MIDCKIVSAVVDVVIDEARLSIHDDEHYGLPVIASHGCIRNKGELTLAIECPL